MNVVPVRLPPLAERREDIPELVNHFLAEAADSGLPLKRLEPTAMEKLVAYGWPGNVRELENFVKRLTVLHAQEVIDSAVVEGELADARGISDGGPAVQSESLGEAVERHVGQYFAAHGEALPASGLYGRVVREVERPLISLSLQATGGNQLRAAELLGLNRNTLRKKIRELDIPVSRGLK